MRFARPFVVLSAAVAALVPAAQGANEHASNHAVCPGPALFSTVRCHARVVTDARGNPLATTSPTGYGPGQFRTAYSLPASAATAQTIAIVDAYDSPTIANDLQVYSQTYGVACNGCFTKVNQSGSSSGPFP